MPFLPEKEAEGKKERTVYHTVKGDYDQPFLHSCLYFEVLVCYLIQ